MDQETCCQPYMSFINTHIALEETEYIGVAPYVSAVLELSNSVIIGSKHRINSILRTTTWFFVRSHTERARESRPSVNRFVRLHCLHSCAILRLLGSNLPFRLRLQNTKNDLSKMMFSSPLLSPHLSSLLSSPAHYTKRQCLCVCVSVCSSTDSHWLQKRQ